MTDFPRVLEPRRPRLATPAAESAAQRGVGPVREPAADPRGLGERPSHGSSTPGRREALDERLVSLVSPHSHGAEQYRALRHLIDEAHRAAGVSVLAVSSPDVGEGKTTTAINLAGALAQAFEGQVLLIDADLRRPAVAARLGIEPERQGLVDAILDRDLTLQDVAQLYAPSNLSIVSAGRFSGVTYEILHSPRLPELLAEARRQYQYVVLDTPPIIPVPDARVVGNWVDRFLLVVCADKTPRKQLGEALNTLSPGKVLGLLFNNDKEPHARHRAYYLSPPADRPAESRDGWGGLVARVGGALGGGLRRWR